MRHSEKGAGVLESHSLTEQGRAAAAKYLLVVGQLKLVLIEDKEALSREGGVEF